MSSLIGLRNSVVLQDYDRHDRAWALDPATGRLTPASGRRHGFVRLPGNGHPVRFPGDPVRLSGEGPAALYADDGTLWLQYGGRRWDCARVTVGHAAQPDGSRLFTVRGPDGPGLELRYTVAAPVAFDPAYDWIDTLADDFFLWVAEQLGDPDRGRGLCDHFRTGFGPG